jgi:hypothetical protein
MPVALTMASLKAQREAKLILFSCSDYFAQLGNLLLGILNPCDEASTVALLK